MEFLIKQSESGKTLSEFGKIMCFNRYNYGRIYSRKSRHNKVINEDDEILIWKKICKINNVTFDASKTDSCEYQNMWNNYFKD